MTSQRQLLRLVLGLVAVTCAIALVVALRTPGYVGTSRRVALEWSCRNHIVWTNDSGTMWLAERARDVSDVETRPPIAGDSALPTRHAEGVLRFDTAKTATFRSDAGGTLILTRQTKGTFYELACTIE